MTRLRVVSGLSLREQLRYAWILLTYRLAMLDVAIVSLPRIVTYGLQQQWMKGRYLLQRWQGTSYVRVDATRLTQADSVRFYRIGATLLAAIRYWQRASERAVGWPHVILQDSGVPFAVVSGWLNSAEAQALCRQLSCDSLVAVPNLFFPVPPAAQGQACCLAAALRLWASDGWWSQSPELQIASRNGLFKPLTQQEIEEAVILLRSACKPKAAPRQ